MKYLLLYIIILTITTSCNSQSTTIKLSEENEIIARFLSSVKPYSYINNKIKDLDLVNDFINSYNSTQIRFKKVDSICKSSNDTIQLKLFCPTAESLSRFKDLLSSNDFEFIKENYNTSLKRTINLDEILLNTIPLQKHSKKHYTLSNTQQTEFPSVEILNIYLTDNAKVAIIAYQIYNETINHGNPSYFILKKIDNVWWKSLGDL